jgi:uncharacterized phage protein (TIGR02220 family)
MKITTKKISDIINEKLTFEERGLLITILILKDSDPKLTLAKVKAKVQMNKYKSQLINLHELGFIEWSGYIQAKNSLEEISIKPQVIEIIDFMNDLYKQNNQYTSKSHYPALLERVKEYSVEDIKMVIANRYEVWKDDKVMSNNLRPSTIFRPSKFDKYFEEAQRTKKGLKFLEIEKVKLKEGEEITLELAQDFSRDEKYYLTINVLDNEGNKIRSETVYKTGKDILTSLKNRDTEIKYGGKKEFMYVYKKE